MSKKQDTTETVFELFNRIGSLEYIQENVEEAMYRAEAIAEKANLLYKFITKEKIEKGDLKVTYSDFDIIYNRLENLHNTWDTLGVDIFNAWCELTEPCTVIDGICCCKECMLARGEDPEKWKEILDGKAKQ